MENGDTTYGWNIFEPWITCVHDELAGIRKLTQFWNWIELENFTMKPQFHSLP